MNKPPSTFVDGPTRKVTALKAAEGDYESISEFGEPPAADAAAAPAQPQQPQKDLIGDLLDLDLGAPAVAVPVAAAPAAGGGDLLGGGLGDILGGGMPAAAPAPAQQVSLDELTVLLHVH